MASESTTNRRGFLARAASAAAAVTLAPRGLGQAEAQTPHRTPSGQDLWLQDVKGIHRCLFDFPQHKNGAPLLHILNYFNTYQEAYKTAPGTVGAIGTFYRVGGRQIARCIDRPLPNRVSTAPAVWNPHAT